MLIIWRCRTPLVRSGLLPKSWLSGPTLCVPKSFILKWATFCTCTANIIFSGFVPHFQDNLRYKLGPFVQHLAIFLCHINLQSCSKVASVLSGTIISLVKTSIKFKNVALEIVSLVSVVEAVHVAKKKNSKWGLMVGCPDWTCLWFYRSPSLTHKQVFIYTHTHTFEKINSTYLAPGGLFLNTCSTLKCVWIAANHTPPKD